MYFVRTLKLCTKTPKPCRRGRVGCQRVQACGRVRIRGTCEMCGRASLWAYIEPVGVSTCGNANVSLEFYNTLAGQNHWCRCQLLPCWIEEEGLLKVQRVYNETIQLLNNKCVTILKKALVHMSSAQTRHVACRALQAIKAQKNESVMCNCSFAS